jgi:hypothetical protein
LEIATDLPPEEKEYKKFVEAGWKLRSSAALSEHWKDYRRYLAESRGEFCVAKNGYVHSRCGWFSDRSACYLALDRPVVLQDTGWSEVLPSGEGLFAFKNEQEAAAAIKKISLNYQSHVEAAKKLAPNHFQGKKVVEKLLDNIDQLISCFL